MGAGVVETNPILTWFGTWGQVVYFLLQVAYWIVVAWAATFAAIQAKRFVDFKLGKVAPELSPSESSVSVDEFVD